MLVGKVYGVKDWERYGGRGTRVLMGRSRAAYIIAEDSVQMNTRDVSVRRSGAGERMVGFVLSRDYPFSGWGTSPAESDFSTAACFSCRTLELVAPMREDPICATF